MVCHDGRNYNKIYVQIMVCDACRFLKMVMGSLFIFGGDIPNLWKGSEKAPHIHFLELCFFFTIITDG